MALSQRLSTSRITTGMFSLLESRRGTACVAHNETTAARKAAITRLSTLPTILRQNMRKGLVYLPRILWAFVFVSRCEGQEKFCCVSQRGCLYCCPHYPREIYRICLWREKNG